MLTTSFETKRTRATALALAFGIVAGGAALVGAPAYAATDASTTPTADATATTGATATTDSTASAAEVAPLAADVVAQPGMTTDKAVYTMDEFMAGAVTYLAMGFTPDVELEIAIVAPDQTVYPVNLDAPIIPDSTGSYSGSLTPTGTWDEGDYAIVLATKDKTLTPQQSATAGFTVGTPAPTPTPTETPSTLQGIITNGAGNVVLQAVADAEGVQYLVTGFTPGTQLTVSGTESDGSPMQFDSNELIEVDGDGNATGVITGTWPVGYYSITVVDVNDPNQAVTIDFEIVADAEAPETTQPTVDTVGGPEQQAPQAPQLAETGADAFGPAGLALATLVAGAGALVASRRLAK